MFVVEGASSASASTDDHGAPCAVSVIIVNWNTRKLTLECLRSLYAQTTQTPFEVLLVDNGSHDGTVEAIAAEFPPADYPNLRVIAEPTNHGFAVANNIAARLARGKRLLLLNSDTVVLDAAVDRVVAFADERPAAGIWGGRTLFGDGSLNYTSCWGRQTLWSVFCFTFGLCKLFPNINFFNPEGMTAWRRNSIREVDVVTGCFLLIDTALWHRLEGFDPIFFMYGEEADLCLRAQRLGARPVITPAATIIHYGHGSAVTRADPQVRLLRAKIALAHRSLGPVSAELVRWLYLVAVALRTVGYGLVAWLRRRPNDAVTGAWAATLKRRDEWFSRKSALIQTRRGGGATAAASMPNS